MLTAAVGPFEKRGKQLFVSAALEVVERCPACESTDLVHERKQPDNLFGIPGRWQLDRCVTCSLVFVNPRPSQVDLEKAYESLFPHHGEPEPAPTRSSLRLQRAWHWLNGSSSFHARFIPAGSGSILDVGCGAGALGATLKRRGYRVFGVELNKTLWGAAQANGVEVLGSTLFDANIRPGSLDAIVYSDVLEHVPEPLRELRQAARSLRPGGRLYVGCPNYAGLQRRVFGDAWHGWHLPFHLSHFSPSALRAVLRCSGFDTCSVKHESPVQFAIASWRTRASSSPLAAWDDMVSRGPASRLLRASLGASLRILSLCAAGDQLVAVAEKSSATR